MQFREHRLHNGLEIIAECNPNAYSTAVAFFVNTGARDETDSVSGVSHFLEHMAFKGTASRSAADVNRELDEIGSHANAFTSEEQTVFYATVLPEWQDRVVEILSDILRPSLRDTDFNLEKKVILEEIAKYEDQPPFGAAEKCMAAHFKEHPLGRSVLGSDATITALTPERMRDYFDERYSPANIVLVAAGNVDFGRLVTEAEARCGHWKRSPVARTVTPAAGARQARVFPKPTAVQQYVVQIANGPAAEARDRYAGRLLATILGDDSGSRLFWELVDTGRAECAALSSCEFQGTGIFITFLCCTPEETENNLGAIHRILRTAERDGVGEEELVRAKSKICSHIVLQAERPTHRMFSVGSNWVQRREYRTVREVVAAYQAVNCEEIAQLLEKYPLTHYTSVAVGPLTAVRLPGCVP